MAAIGNAAFFAKPLAPAQSLLIGPRSCAAAAPAVPAPGDCAACEYGIACAGVSL